MRAISNKSASGYNDTIGESLIDSSKNPYSNVSSGNGFACDLSFLFPLSENLLLGFNLKNLPVFMFWEKYSTDTIPWTIMSGIGYVYKSLRQEDLRVERRQRSLIEF
ncbi:MAG: hypothetical protein LE178_06595 [Endomicrobium sp.]|nr:hypothetical protein [Endomicrobium sp.]